MSSQLEAKERALAEAITRHTAGRLAVESLSDAVSAPVMRELDRIVSIAEAELRIARECKTAKDNGVSRLDVIAIATITHSEKVYNDVVPFPPIYNELYDGELLKLTVDATFMIDIMDEFHLLNPGKTTLKRRYWKDMIIQCENTHGMWKYTQYELVGRDYEKHLLEYPIHSNAVCTPAQAAYIAASTYYAGRLPISQDIQHKFAERARISRTSPFMIPDPAFKIHQPTINTRALLTAYIQWHYAARNKKCVDILWSPNPDVLSVIVDAHEIMPCPELVNYYASIVTKEYPWRC